MKKIVVITIGTSVLIALLAYCGAFDALFIFALTGTITGTTYTVSPNTMMLLISSLTCFVLFHSLAATALRMIFARYYEDSATPAKQQLPKRRFGEI